jgi:Ca2+/H+ antiporter, TMEM165/GDT1 family
MKKLWIALIAPPAVVLFTWLFGELVMHLWNWLLPPIFGLHMITFWQALGLLLLSRILFGSWGAGGGNRGRRGRREKWDKMSPEERERLRQSSGARCGGFVVPPGESKEPA